MKGSFLDFINKKERNKINESFSQKNIDKVCDLISNYLKKEIKGIIPLVGYVNISDSNNEYLTKQFIIIGKKVGQEKLMHINWLKSSDKLDAYSIDFFDNLNLLYDKRGKSNLTIYTLDSSIVYFLPVIKFVLSKGSLDLSEKEAINYGRSIFKNSDVKESFIYINNYRCHLIENLSDDIIRESFLYEETDYELRKLRKEKKKELDRAYWKRNNSDEDNTVYQKLKDEYEEIKQKIASGGNLDDLKVTIKKGVTLTEQPSKEEEEAEEEFTGKHDDPEVVFKKMEQYIKMVIKGINPSLILCGAPGVGKTFRVKKELKAAGYQEDRNLFTIKGKCTPRRLYISLYDYRKKGDILLIDDADSLIGPKAPEDCINILKGALDSSSDKEGRLITYGVAGKILDDEGEELPKRFYYNGSVIIITNYNAGQLDTALRGRSYIQDIHFTPEDVLKIIKNLLPTLESEIVSIKSKNKAYEYITELVENKEKVEISIRTFLICAKIFESAEDLDDSITKDMIKEQMRLQSLRGGKKY